MTETLYEQNEESKELFVDELWNVLSEISKAEEDLFFLSLLPLSSVTNNDTCAFKVPPKVISELHEYVIGTQRHLGSTWGKKNAKFKMFSSKKRWKKT